jgi:phospholipid/cholesterol/gamma-HCH transport system substrate-binding protein
MGKDSYALMTGIFVATLITGIVVIIIWLGDVQHQTHTYVAATRDSVTGLKAGSIVYYRGIEVGKVSAVRFDAKDPDVIIVPMEVDNEVKFSRGVYATLELQGVTGLTRIALKDSGDNPEPLPSGGQPNNRIPIKPSLIDRLSVSGEDTVNETHELMLRLNRLMDEKNSQHIERILANVETATGQFIKLQQQADKTLAGLPGLTTEAKRTLSHFDVLSGDFKQLNGDMRKEVQTLAKKTGYLADSATIASDMLVQTTLPRANTLMAELQMATRRFNRVAAMLETDPQALLLGRQTQSGPGEPGFEGAK